MAVRDKILNSELTPDPRPPIPVKKFAFVAIIGRPSAGKSTLLNRMCGEKVAIVSKVPQTTRDAIRGIVNKDQGQLVFIDTPGRHVSEKKFNKKLQDVSNRALEDSDLVLYVMDATRTPGVEEDEIIEKLKEKREKILIAINKIDVRNDYAELLKKYIREKFSVFSVSSVVNKIFPISAQTGQGIDELLNALFNLAPEGEPQYDAEYYTDQEVSFRIAEIIRGQAINRLRQELPHSIMVEIADIELKEGVDDTGKMPVKRNDSKQQSPVPCSLFPVPCLWVRAFLIVERESQKGMVVGKGGEMIKAIRLASLKELKQIFDWKIDLDLRVKTGDWKKKF